MNGDELFSWSAAGAGFTLLQEMDTASDSTVTLGSLNHNESFQKTHETCMCETGINKRRGDSTVCKSTGRGRTTSRKDE